MTLSDNENANNILSSKSNSIPQNSIIRDTQLIEKKLPASNIPYLENNIKSFNLGDSDFEDDSFNGNCNDNDFIEYQYNKPHYSKKESLNLIDHNFAKVEDDYRKKLEIDKSNEEKNNENSLNNEKKIKLKELDIKDDSDSDNEWKEIDTQLNCGNIYNLKGEKVDYFIHSKDDITQQNTTTPIEKPKKKKTQLQKVAKNSATVGKKVLEITAGVKIGKDETAEQLRQKYQRVHLNNSDNPTQTYTRIDEEEQAKKFNEMDKKFDFLFQNENSNLRKLHNAQSTNNSVDTLSKVTDDFMNKDNFEEIFDNEGHDENELNPSIQMMSTKSMLTDSQKIAYAALVKLIIVQLTTDLIKVRGSGSTKILKKLAICHRSFMRWSMNIMNALYNHLDIKKNEEIQMIETLSCHGVETSDLTKTFNSNVAIENHLNENNDKDLQLINMNVTDLESSNTIEIDIKWTLICDLFLILLESSVYDARSRTLLLNFAEAIGITNLEMFQFERRITDSLEIDEAFEILNNNQTWDESDILKEHKKKQRNAKIVKIALATAAGGLVIGLSAGALAPVIGAGLAAGLTTIGITGTSGFLAGTAGTAIITTSGVVSGMRAGKNAMNHRVGSVKTFEFIPLHNNRRVNLIITVSGWMSGTMDDVRLPFSTVDQVMGDLYSLLWEPEMLTSMGQTINILANEILTQSIQQILGSTLLITLMAGLQLPMMLSKLGYLLDNPWNNSLDRAWRSGKVLADTLRRNKLGVRPITLVGFSLGARLIYSCLLSLAKTGDYGIVENVYLFGSPLVIHEDEIAQARSVVSGKFINGYMKQDWILGYLFRATSGGLRTIAGLSPVNEEKYNIKNYNCSEFVKGHMQYREAMPKLLRMVGWEVLEDQFVEIEQPNPEEEERQRKLLSDFEKAQHSKKKKSWYNKIFGRRNKEWWEMYEEGEKESKKKHQGDTQDSGNDNELDTDEELENLDDSTDKSCSFNIDALKEEIANIEKEAQKVEKKQNGKAKTKNIKLEDDDESEKSKKDGDKILKAKDKEIECTENLNISSTKEKEPYNSNFVKDVNIAEFNIKPKSEVSANGKKNQIDSRKLRKRPSIIQLVESKNVNDKKTSFEKSPELNNLKPFRISSQNSKKSTNYSETGRTNSLNIGVVQSVVGKEDDINENPKDNLTDVHHQVETNNSKEIININEKNKEVENDNDDRYKDLKSIDYGEYEIPKEENIQIFFDDDLDAIEKKINETQKDKPGYGPVTGIDYGDEKEFPKDESNVQFSFE